MLKDCDQIKRDVNQMMIGKTTYYRHYAIQSKRDEIVCNANVSDFFILKEYKGCAGSEIQCY